MVRSIEHRAGSSKSVARVYDYKSSFFSNHLKKLQTELKRTEQVVKRRVSLSNQDVTKQVYCCLLCEQTPLPEGQYSEQNWKVCHDCQNTLCPNCVVQIGKNVDSEMFWLCKLCQKKRQLTVSSGSWLQGLPKNNNNKQTKELQKLIKKTHGITRTASYSQYEDLIDQGTNMIDEIQKITPTVIIDEKASETKNFVQSTYTNVPYDNNDQTVVSLCTASPTNILSHHHTDRQQFLPEDYVISSTDYLSTPYNNNNNSSQGHSIESNHDIITSNYNENMIESFNFYPINHKDYQLDEDLFKIYQNLQQSSLKQTSNQLSMDQVGLIIPQYNSSNEYNEDIDHQNLLLPINWENKSYHLQMNNQIRRQSCPIITDSVSSPSPSSSSNQVIRQQPSFTTPSSYFEDIHSGEDVDDEEKLIHLYDDQHDSYDPNILYNHEIHSNHLNLFFPYNLNESWDYTEDLRKIDENIYQRTTIPCKTTDLNTTTYDTVTSSIFNENENNILYTAISTGTTNVTSIESYYIDKTIQPLYKDQDINFKPSMNDLYLNWLNELNPGYNSMNQQDTSYNVNKHEDYMSESSLMNDTVLQGTSVSNLITTTTTYGNINVETTEQNHLLLKRCPNFENISRLSNNNNNIQLTEKSESFYEGLMQLSEIINDEKEDLEMNNDTPTKVWGREFRDRLQIQILHKAFIHMIWYRTYLEKCQLTKNRSHAVVLLIAFKHSSSSIQSLISTDTTD
ncbi:putative rabphilin [Schistosoma mansoni]|uniref:putative rabphilin n=1 Tax=Schistosoma mansoni TaxID=6183 RepID=UPI00022DC6FA|nr:putative rabphilin [Schistosoma mansoni]|eukprot:XP_018652218.1 putative rabphilin [Schistosoma mansoni]